MEAKMAVINPNACGIDVGSKMHYVATGQGSEEVKSFGVYTKDHLLLRTCTKAVQSAGANL